MMFQSYLQQTGDSRCIDDIKKDLHRQFPFHEMFQAKGGHGYVFIPFHEMLQAKGVDMGTCLFHSMRCSRLRWWTWVRVYSIP